MTANGHDDTGLERFEAVAFGSGIKESGNIEPQTGLREGREYDRRLVERLLETEDY
ncbi:hypothetical protein [Natrinema salsiterrestre]|uniref:Uncharacterized protein n=1 Tax=Natrinema salsiterrestre TaxID=2950540 RepID=A0A9Q4L536_9EURY|nr:hypothetical protein [Natrinema salsiterrestre]MDF9747802.1 hypothetical protein [Natrinema salsiterrestre]